MSRAGLAARRSEQGRTDGRDETEPLDAPWGARGRMSERHSMRKIREVLRLKHELEAEQPADCGGNGGARETVGKYLARAKAAGLTWEVGEGLSDAEVEGRLFEQMGRNEPAARAPIDFDWVHMELRRAGVTRQLLWSGVPGGGCARDRKRQAVPVQPVLRPVRGVPAKLQPSMRQVHRAGEKAFIDYSGKKPRIVDATTGERDGGRAVCDGARCEQLHVCGGNPHATPWRTSWVATVRGLEYFGAVPEILVPDQLQAARYRKADRMEPEINATYAEMAQHYGTAVVPGASSQTEGQGEGRGGRAGRAAVDPGLSA